jgi:hypothetical protein
VAASGEALHNCRKGREAREVSTVSAEWTRKYLVF